MTQADGAVADFHSGNRLLAKLDTIEKVLAVVCAGVQVCLIYPYR
jgi:hypothetical protein